jgi:exodeoxyribonuclease VII large subunit
VNPSPVAITVSQAITLCNAVLSEVPLVIEGEVANYSVSRGMYVFFDLKDETQEARLSCFMMLRQLSVPIENGMRVIVSGRPTVFVKSGKLSITLTRVELKGEGSVKRAFELLKAKLTEEGLFAADRKRPLPRFPKTVGVISSLEAAGYGDFMRIADSRMRGISFVTAHVAVQGKDAENEISLAFDYLNSHYTLDVIVLVRGGGSMEDLHAFNSEIVVRAISRSKAPVLVGVGHERDVTIADYCADVRASTPSAAAQILLPTTEEVAALVEKLIQDGYRRVSQRIAAQREQLISKTLRLGEKLRFVIATYRQRVEAHLRTIDAVSPEATLKRGYSITWNEDGTPVRSAADVSTGQKLTTQLATDTITSTAL